MNSYMSWIALGVTVLGFAGMYYLQKRKINFGWLTIIGLGLGLIIGFVFQGYTEYVTLFGQGFTRLIYVMVVPLLFFSIISSISNLNDTRKLKSLGFRSIFWLLLNTAIAATIAVIVSTTIKLGQGFTIVLPDDYVAAEIPSFTETIVNFIPSNIVSHMANNQVIPIIVFALLVGVSVVKLNMKKPDVAKIAINVFNSMNEVMGVLIKSIIKLTPYAVVSYIANIPTRDGGKDLASFIIVIVVAFALCLFQILVVDSILVKFFAKLSPKKFLKAIWPAQVVAFTSQSSIGTVPVLAEQLTDELGMNKEVVGFVTGLGANIGMPACTGMWPVLLAIFSVNALNIPFEPYQYVLLIVLTIVVGLGTAGVPGTATVAATAVLSAVGLPIEIIFVLAPISALVDMIRTVTNVTGSATATAIVAHQLVDK